MLSDTLHAGALATRLISQEFEVGMLTILIEKQAPDYPEVDKLQPGIHIKKTWRFNKKNTPNYETKHSDLNPASDWISESYFPRKLN